MDNRQNLYAILRACSCSDAGLEESVAQLVASRAVEDADSDGEILFPLLFLRLKEVGMDHPQMDRLRIGYGQSWLWNQQLLTRTTPILEVSEEMGMAPVVMKGGGMASSAYYNDLGSRPMRDIDIMVPRDQITDLVEWALGHGWVPSPNPLTPDEILFAYHSIDLLWGQDGATDIHHSLIAGDRSPDLDRDLLRRTLPATLGDRSVTVLQPSAQFVHTLAHEHNRSMRGIADAVFILNHRLEELDWAWIEEQVVGRRCISQVLESLEKIARIQSFDEAEDLVSRLAIQRRHWTDYPRIGRTVPSRRRAVKDLAAHITQLNRRNGPVDGMRVARLVTKKYGESSAAGSVGAKVSSILISGPTSAG